MAASPQDFDRSLVEAKEVALAGNAPLVLGAPPTIWEVEGGAVDVFAVPRGETGPRTHLCSVAPGQVLCGVDASPVSSLLAVGPSGTFLRQLPVESLQEIAGNPEAAADLAGRLDGWVGGPFGEITRAAGPKIFEELRPGVETTLAEAGRVTRARAGVVWVRHLEGSSSLLGEADLALGEGDLIPLPEGLWLVSAGEARLAGIPTHDLLATAEL